MSQPEHATLLSLDSLHLFAASGGLCVVGAAGIAATSWVLAHRRPGRTPKLTEADQGIMHPSVVRDGSELHRTVPMERWCVTRDDLRQFKRLVQHAVKEGRIVPTAADPFDPHDTSIGPSTHTVCAQFIVPVTKVAGGASWALMLHPEGLPCDLFVTHCWAEGTYEFVDKVLHSWPRGACHAYCCMLSNPQNLDVAGLMAAPIDSPFARALCRATHVLVVPNRTGSVYTRVWCAYEAFLGYTWGKLISTASAPVPGFWIRAVQGQCVSLLGLGVGVASAPLGFSTAAGNLSIVAVLLLFCLWWCLHRAYAGSAASRYTKVALEFMNAAQFGSRSLLQLPLDLGDARYSNMGTPLLIQLLVEGIFVMTIPCTLEADGQWEAQAAEQVRQLRRGFTGRLGDAQSSVPADGNRIRQELADSGSEAAVDDAVNVLICMGMSSPQLRETVARAGVLGNVGRWSSSLVLSVLMNVPLRVAWLPWLEGLGIVLWVAVILSMPQDRRAFAAASQLLLLLVFAVFVVESVAGHHSSYARVSTLASVLVLGVGISLLGPARVARLPLLGPTLVRALLGAHPCVAR